MNAGKLLRLNTYHCFYFNSNALKIELQYQWTPPQIFFCRYRLLQLFSHNDFRDLVLSLPEASLGGGQ